MEEITAPISGKIMKILIKEGDNITEDQEIFMIEAMKMETMVYAPCGGTITEVRVSEGDTVEEEDIMAIVETS